MKIKEKSESLHNKNLHNKTEYVIHIKNLKQALSHGLVLKKILTKTHILISILI